MQAQLGEHFCRGADLALAAIDDHEVGHLPAQLLLAPLFPSSRPSEAAPQDLLVRGEVVRTRDGLDPEPSVLPRPRLALLEHDHAADRLGTLDVADVVALDAHRHGRQVQGRRQLLQRRQRLALVGQPASLLASQRLGRVPLGQFHQVTLLAAPGRPQMDGTSPPATEERLQHRAFGQGTGQQHFPWDGRRARIELFEEAGQDLVVGGVVGRLQQEYVPSDQLAAPNVEQLDGSLVVLARQADQVELGSGEGGHLLALHGPLDGSNLVPQRSRALVFGGFGRRDHFGLQALDQGLAPALEEQLHLGDVGAVVLLRDRLDARSLAALDVVQQAGSLEGALPVLDIDGARPEREQPPDQVHRLVHRRRRRVRPEVPAAVVGQLAGALDAREVVGPGDLDVGVALVVLEADVEARLVALDQVRLEEERLADRVGDRVFDVGDSIHGGLDAQRRPAAPPLPVAAHTMTEALRLADVEHLALGVLHEVHAGPVGEILEGRLELGAGGGPGTRGGHPPMLWHGVSCCRFAGLPGRAPIVMRIAAYEGGKPAVRRRAPGARSGGDSTHALDEVEVRVERSDDRRADLECCRRQIRIRKVELRQVSVELQGQFQRTAFDEDKALSLQERAETGACGLACPAQ